MADFRDEERSAASSSPETYRPAHARWGAETFLGRFVPVALAGLLGPLGPAMLFRIIALNAIAGVVFGWLFRRYTLESAMVSHACVPGVIFLAAIAGLA